MTPPSPVDVSTSWTPRRALAATVFVAFAFVPLWPPVALAILGLLGIRWAILRQIDPADVDRRELVLLGLIVLLGCSAQLMNWLARPTPPPLDAAPVRVDDRAANLSAAYDVSWLRGWRDDGGLGPYAEPVGSGFWRLDAFDGDAAPRITEAISALEVAIEAGMPYTLSVVLRHDGTWIDAVLLERTREGRRRLPTVARPIGPKTVQLQATVPARDEAAALRSLHLTELAGDWTHVDIGWPSLIAGEEPAAYTPHAAVPPWHEGIVWWLTLGVALAAAFTVLRTIDRHGARRWAAYGLVVGLLLQAIVAVQQAWSGDAASRAVGTMGEPNLLAHVAAITAVTVVAVSRRPFRDGAWALGAAGVAVWLSGSRAGLVGLALGAVAMGLALPLNRRARVAYAVGTVLVVAVGLVGAGSLSSRLTDPWLASADVMARLQVWETSWAASAARPLAGYGHDRVGWVYEFWPVDEPGPRHRNYHAHNVGLQLLVSFGWPTVLAFALASLALVWRAWRMRMQPALVVLLVVFALNSIDLTLFHPSVFLSAVTATVFGTKLKDPHRAA